MEVVFCIVCGTMRPLSEEGISPEALNEVRRIAPKALGSYAQQQTAQSIAAAALPRAGIAHFTVEPAALAAVTADWAAATVTVRVGMAVASAAAMAGQVMVSAATETAMALLA